MKLAHKSDGFNTIGKPQAKVEEKPAVVVEEKQVVIVEEKVVVKARKYMAETSETLIAKADVLREALRLTVSQSVSTEHLTEALYEVEEELLLRNKLK